jgi:hypothetical protein
VDKYSSLSRILVNYRRKKFYNNGHSLFFPGITDEDFYLIFLRYWRLVSSKRRFLSTLFLSGRRHPSDVDQVSPWLEVLSLLPSVTLTKCYFDQMSLNPFLSFWRYVCRVDVVYGCVDLTSVVSTLFLSCRLRFYRVVVGFVVLMSFLLCRRYFYMSTLFLSCQCRFYRIDVILSCRRYFCRVDVISVVSCRWRFREKDCVGVIELLFFVNDALAE